MSPIRSRWRRRSRFSWALIWSYDGPAGSADGTVGMRARSGAAEAAAGAAGGGGDDEGARARTGWTGLAAVTVWTLAAGRGADVAGGGATGCLDVGAGTGVEDGARSSRGGAGAGVLLRWIRTGGRGACTRAT